ncbi:MAG TPA: glycosyltransferase family 9 protein, partial [Pyrinomonadaceae bacterium]|nr:glycosyltransferase family 9 protein [Pyrinomonadaceae bacterium]
MITGPQLDLSKIKRVLVVRLRSIGDTVLITPSLIALRRALPNAKIDVLLEDWVAPVLDGFDQIDEVLSFNKSSKRSRFAVAREIRKREYDVAFNLHGGTTSTFFVRVSGAKHRVGYGHYRYSFLYNHLLTSSADFWGRAVTHSAEQHLALIGSVGIPVDDRPKTRLDVTESAAASLNSKFNIQDSASDSKSKIQNPKSKVALLHPVAAFETKELAVGKFAEIAEFLSTSGFEVVAVGAPNEREKVERLRSICKV